MKINKINLNLILILAIVAVISVPIAYALVESSIVINMLPSQTTDPFVVKDSFGVEVFAVEIDGTIVVEKIQFDDVNTRIDQVGNELIYNIATGFVHKFLVNDIIQATLDASNLNLFGNNLINAVIDGDLNTILDISEDQMNVKVGASGTVLTSNGVALPPTYQAGGGGEVFTWTGNHSASGNSLTNLDILEFASVEQNIRDNGFGDLIFNVASTEAYLLKMGGITEFQFFGTGNGNQFALVEQNSITWNTDGHDITPSATDLTINVGTVNDRINLRTFDTDRFTINGQNAQISVPFDFNSNAITEASIDCNVNTCTNFPAGDAYIYGSLFDNISPSSNRFVFPSGQIDNIGDESKMQMIVQKDGTVEKFFVKYVTNDLDMATTVIVRLNGIDTSVGVIIPASSIAVHADEISSFTVVKGDLISINFVTTGGNGSGTNPLWSFEIEGL